MRLFIAFEVPDAWRDAAVAAQSTVRTRLDGRFMRFVDPMLMHLTLRFLGEVDPADHERLDRSLREAIHAIDVSLTLSTAGTFGRPERTAVAWLGVDGELAALDTLVATIERAVVSAGLPAEARAFRPHLTLARVQRAAPPTYRRALADLVAILDAPPPAPVRFHRISLVHSLLGGAQPRYHVLARYGLEPPERAQSAATDCDRDD